MGSSPIPGIPFHTRTSFASPFGRLPRIPHHIKRPMSTSIRTYQLYPTVNGYSNRSVDYRGTVVTIAAKSIKQAYYLAGNGIWFGDENAPVGILEWYRRGKGSIYWSSRDEFTHQGPHFDNNMSKTEIVEKVKSYSGGGK